MKKSQNLKENTPIWLKSVDMDNREDNWYDEDGYFHCENCETCPKYDGENCLMP